MCLSHFLALLASLAFNADKDIDVKTYFLPKALYRNTFCKKGLM